MKSLVKQKSATHTANKMKKIGMDSQSKQSTTKNGHLINNQNGKIIFKNKQKKLNKEQKNLSVKQNNSPPKLSENLNSSSSVKVVVRVVLTHSFLTNLLKKEMDQTRKDW